METTLSDRNPNLFARLYEFLICRSSSLQSAVLLILRLTWGWQIAESGFAHLSNVAATADQFAKWGVPLPTLNVYISASTELMGGSLLILGLAARLISIPLVFNFIVAYAAASRDTFTELLHGQLQKGYDDFINDSAFSVMILALIMLAFGPGKASIDYLLERTLFRKPVTTR